MRMAQVPVKFKPYNELDDIEDYCEQLKLFFTANQVADDKKAAHLLNGLGTKTYGT